MNTPLSKWENRKARFVKWIMYSILFKISPLGVLSFCLEVANLYHETIESSEESMNENEQLRLNGTKRN